jgi:hypothetical protein
LLLLKAVGGNNGGSVLGTMDVYDVVTNTVVVKQLPRTIQNFPAAVMGEFCK